MPDDGGIWVYAIAGHGPEIDGITGVGDRPVRVIGACGVHAMVSDVSLDEFGESALHANLEDMSWLEATAKAHHRVIDELTQSLPVVPMRLATVFTSDGRVQTLLTERGEEIREVLSRISKRKEWGVKAFAVQPALVPASPYSRDADRPAQDGSGSAYLQRRRAELATGKQARQDAIRNAAKIHAALSHVAADSRLHPPQVPELAGTKAAMLLNAAYLLDETRDRAFSEAVRQLASQFPAVQLQITGPWPPYSFASLDPSTRGEVT